MRRPRRLSSGTVTVRRGEVGDDGAALRVEEVAEHLAGAAGAADGLDLGGAIMPLETSAASPTAVPMPARMRSSPASGAGRSRLPAVELARRRRG